MFQWCPTCPTMTREMDKCEEKDVDQKMDLGQYLKIDIRYPERDKDPPDTQVRQVRRVRQVRQVRLENE